jgi:hypothetical protein
MSYDKSLDRTGIPKTWRRGTQKYTILAMKSLGNQPLRRKKDIGGYFRIGNGLEWLGTVSSCRSYFHQY